MQLKRSLTAKCYYAEFYVVLADAIKLATNNIGMYITTTIQTADTNSPAKYYIPADPQVLNYGNPIIKDTQNWVRVSGVFSAAGGEQYITIGNFKPDTATAIDSFNVSWYARRSVYGLDDVAVYDLDSIPQYVLAGRDTSIALGDSVFIGSHSGGLQNAVWYNSSGAVINTAVPGFWVKPTASTYYVLQLAVCSSFRQDTVRVNVGATPLKFTNYALRQAQGDKVENLWTTANEINVSHFNVQRSVNGRDFITIGKVSANNKSYNEYSYEDNSLPFMVYSSVVYYRIESVDRDGRKQYSGIRNVELGIGNGVVSIFPNPAKDAVRIECKGMKQVSIVNCLGIEISRQEPRNDVVVVNVRGFAKGLYVVKVITENGATEITKFIKE